MKNRISKIIESNWYQIILMFYILLVAIIFLFSIDFLRIRNFVFTEKGANQQFAKGLVVTAWQKDGYELGDRIAYFYEQDKEESVAVKKITEVGGNVFVVGEKENERELIRGRLIMGEFIFKIPYLGYLISFFRTIVGFWLLIWGPAIFIMVMSALYGLEQVKLNK